MSALSCIIPSFPPRMNALDTAFGDSYVVSPAVLRPGAFIPEYLQKGFSFHELRVQEQRYLLVTPEDLERSSAALAELLHLFSAAYGLRPVLWAENASRRHARAWRREGLWYLTGTAGRSFDGDSDSSDSSSREPRERVSTMLSPCAQTLVVRQLVRGDVVGCRLREMASRLPYSAALLGRAKDELLQHRLCRYAPGTRAGCFRFSLSREELWQAALPLLSSPVRASYRVRKDLCSGLPLAGMSALAALTDITDNPLPTFAYYARSLQKRLPQAPIAEAGAILQLWSYPPEAVLGEHPTSVDSCSLYLSLRGELDPRIEIARSRLWPS